MLFMIKLKYTYISPSIDVVEVLYEGGIMSMSGGTFGVDGWDESGEDNGGDATWG